MSKLFEAFKKYHNANYYDGDNTFDDEVYKKSNGEDFDNDFVQDCFDHFEAGWQEQQKVIDEYVMVAESLDESYVRECKKNKALQEHIKDLESQVAGLITFHQIRDISDKADELRKDTRLTDHQIDL